MRRLNMLDASWLLVESPETAMQVAGLQIFRLPKNAPSDFMQKFVAYLRSFPVSTPPFNYRLARGAMAKLAPAWETVRDVDIDYHLRHSALPAPGGERELGVLISRLHSIALDKTKPLWECHVIEGLEPTKDGAGRFALYIKAHHSLLDGMAAVRIIQSTLSEDPNFEEVPPPWSRPVPKVPRAERMPVSPLEQMREQFGGLPSAIRALRIMRAVRKKKGEEGLVAPYTSPPSILNTRVTAQRRVATQSHDLARYKKLAQLGDCTLNDIVLAICGGALRRYLSEMNALPEKPLIANLPVSVRPKDDGEGAGNAISTMLASLATDVPDVRERLEVIKQSTVRGKEHLQSMPRAAITHYTTLIMLPFMVGQLTGRINIKRPMFNTVVSNVPGPKNPLYFNGAEMEAVYPVSLIFDGQALNITVLSYADRINWSFTACRTSLPHVQRLAVYTGEAVDELEDVLNGSAKKRRKAA
ncbi:MAG TPA: wax ester/triacylglycerol synthase family O-acyltransferase [Nevskiaceae bacterium]|nr:wax ester/triacylglycerol synthase family O-acyltransferase [Nevskiaceae bacterium]